jgi:Tfp pilus assembly protein PilV
MKKSFGFSLIEQLVTLVVTSTAVLGVVKFQATMFDAELNSKQRAEAVSLAQQQLDVLRSVGYEDSQVSGNDHVQGSTTSFTRTWTVTPDSSLKFDTSSVTVAWATKGSGNTVSLASRIADTSQADAGQFMLGMLGGNTVASSSANPSNGTPSVQNTTDDHTSPASTASSDETEKSSNRKQKQHSS